MPCIRPYSFFQEEYATIKRKIDPLIKAAKETEAALKKVETARAEYAKKQTPNKEQKKENAEADWYSEHKQLEGQKDEFLTDIKTFLAKEYQEADTFIKVVDAHRIHLEEMMRMLAEETATLKSIIKEKGKRPCFGDPLERHLAESGRTIAEPLEVCAGQLRKIGLRVEGLFRIPGATGKIKSLAASFDVGVHDWKYASRDIHSIASVIKKYLRELPDPLLTFRLNDEFMKLGARFCAGPSPAVANAKNALDLSNLLQKLPRENYENLAFLFKLLEELSAVSEDNKMNPAAIATVIGPNLVWPQPPAILNIALYPHLNRIIEERIVNFRSCFPPDQVIYRDCHFFLEYLVLVFFS